MKKILLNFNKDEYTKKVFKLNSASISVQALVNSINSICSLKINNDLLKDILLNKGDKVAEAIESSVIADLNKVNIKSSSIRNAAVKGDLETYYSILKGFSKPEYEISQALSLDDKSQVTVSTKAQQALEESCKQYLTSEGGLEVYNTQKRLIEAMNDFIKACPMFNALNILQAFSFQGREVVASNLDYDRIAKTIDQ
jgi:hypothetical protein